jgi:hypothetical protein
VGEDFDCSGGMIKAFFLQKLPAHFAKGVRSVFLDAHLNDTLDFSRGDVKEDHEAGNDPEIAHGHKKKVLQNLFCICTAVKILAYVVKSLEMEDSPVELGTDLFGLLERILKPLYVAENIHNVYQGRRFERPFEKLRVLTKVEEKDHPLRG